MEYIAVFELNHTDVDVELYDVDSREEAELEARKRKKPFQLFVEVEGNVTEKIQG